MLQEDSEETYVIFAQQSGDCYYNEHNIGKVTYVEHNKRFAEALHIVIEM
jgi:hypothetical protein